jgi:hypothetical protein
LNWLFATLDPRSYEVLLTTMVKKERTGGWLTPRLAALMGTDRDAAAAADLGELIRATAARLDELISEKRKLIVAVDAAHLAETPDALGEIVAFLNLSSLAGTCLSFVLCGETPLLDAVAGAAPLAARAAFTLNLPRLGLADTESYLAHRTRIAGIPSPFEPGAVSLIHDRSRGVLAAINGYAETCLIEAALKGTGNVTLDVAREAARHLGGPSLPHPSQLPGQPAGRGPGERVPGERAQAERSSTPPPPAPGMPLKNPFTTHVPGLDADPPAAAAPAKASGDAPAPPPAPKEAAIKLTALFKAEPRRQKS